MGLFEKKFCDICGEKIGLFGTRKLEDGKICSRCAGKLSPWFGERRRSTLEEIKAQLAYREDNRRLVAEFHTTRSLGGHTRVLLDEDARRFLVTEARDLAEANPDVLDYAQVTGCELDIDEHRQEEYRQVDGKSVSYNPRRFRYSYDFYVTIRVNHRYFSEMRFRLNSSSVEVGSQPMGAGLGGWGLHRPGAGEYQQYIQMGNEIKEALTQARQEAREEIQAQNAPKAARVCPFCGATTFPDASGRCEYCGSPVGDA